VSNSEEGEPSSRISSPGPFERRVGPAVLRGEQSAAWMPLAACATAGRQGGPGDKNLQDWSPRAAGLFCDCDTLTSIAVTMQTQRYGEASFRML